MGLINCLVLSDFHTGHIKVKPQLCQNNTEEYLFPHLNDELDILIIPGDFFDRLLDLSSDAGYVAIRIINTIIELSIRHNFLIKVMRGTFSHDRHQCRFFLAEKYDHITYIDTLTLEYVEKFDIHIMYMPDDLPIVDKQQAISELLEANHLTKVDLFCHHGYLTHLVQPSMESVKAKALDSDWISNKCYGGINGHIHNYSVYKNIISIGAFECTEHGYHGKPGFVQMSYDKNNHVWTHKHIVNEGAVKFLTYEALTSNTDDYEDWLNNLNHKTDELIYIRVKLYDSHDLSAYRTVTKLKFTNVIFTTSYNKIKTVNETKIHRHEPSVKLTPDNLMELLCERCKGNMDEKRIKQLLIGG